MSQLNLIFIVLPTRKIIIFVVNYLSTFIIAFRVGKQH